jgi:phosphopantetheinyl transferase (holo-ACP synthase)
MKLYLYDHTAPGASEELLRAAAADYCGVAHCGDAFTVAHGPHGKPYFSAPPLRDRVHFSLSHSGAYLAVLFHDAQVGLDIEDLRIRSALTKERMERIAARFFTEDERQYVLAGERSGLRQRFFDIWTAKEAYIKYTGRGMSEKLSSFSALQPPDGVTITTFSPGPGLICSRCAREESDPEAARPDGGDGHHDRMEIQGGPATASTIY